jgi:hypothetical protein
MKDIEAIGIFDSRFLEFNNSIIEYCSKYEIPLSYTEHDNDIKYLKYLELLAIKLYDRMLNSESNYFIVFGPYLKINYLNIRPDLFFSKNFDMLFFLPFSMEESWSFFIVKKTTGVLSSLKKIIGLEAQEVSFRRCAKLYNDSVKDYQLRVKNILSSFNVEVLDNFNGSVISHFSRKKEIFNAFCTSFLNDSLDFKSKIANTKDFDADIKVSNSKHYFNDICVVSLYTEDNLNYAKYSLNSITDYCNKHFISYKFYNRPLITGAAPNWSKAMALSYIMAYYDTVIWIDSDCLITNDNFKLREFCSTIPRDLILFKDPSSFFDFNSGVMIFKKSKFTINYLNEVQSEILCKDDLSGIYTGGGDQYVFNKRLRDIDPNGDNSIILPPNLMNSHPIIHQDSDFLVHAMGYGSEYREKYLAYLYQKNKV